MNAFLYKLIAVVTMILGTIGMKTGSALEYAGAISFPIYAFLLAEGFRWYKDDKKRMWVHIIRLLALMVLSELAFDVCMTGKVVDWSVQSVVLSLFLGIFGLFLTDQFAKDEQMYVLVIYFVFAYITYILNGEMMVSGVLSVFGFYWFLEKAEEDEFPDGKKILILVFAGLVYGALTILAAGKFQFVEVLSTLTAEALPRVLFSVVAFVLPAFYNDKLGFKNKITHLVYPWIYPALLLVLSFVL